jgi:hypothetical protein
MPALQYLASAYRETECGCVSYVTFRRGFFCSAISAVKSSCSGLRLAVRLGASAKLRNVTISFVVVVRMEQVDFHWTEFGEICYLGVSKIRLENSSFIKIRQE